MVVLRLHDCDSTVIMHRIWAHLTPVPGWQSHCQNIAIWLGTCAINSRLLFYRQLCSLIVFKVIWNILLQREAVWMYIYRLKGRIVTRTALTSLMPFAFRHTLPANYYLKITHLISGILQSHSFFTVSRWLNTCASGHCFSGDILLCFQK